MLDRFRRRLSSISKGRDGKKALLNDKHVDLFSISLSSSSRPTTSHVTVNSEDEVNAENAPDTTKIQVSTISQMIRRPDNSASRLFSLPAELLIQLQQYLTEGSEVSLRQSCSRFFHMYSCPSFYLAGDDRFSFLCQLERDNPNPSRGRTTLVCGHCRDLHAKSAFPSSELRKLPQERDCRQVWLCPHRAMGYEKASHRIRAHETLLRVENLDPCIKCKSLIRHRSVANQPGKPPYRRASDTDCLDSSIAGKTLLISKIGILQKPSPSDARGPASSLNTEIFPTKEVAAALSGLDFCLCSHMRLGDPYILSKFCRSCLSVRLPRQGEKGPPCISFNNSGERTGKCRGICYDKGCNTGFMFQSRESLLPDVSGRRQIWLILGIYRWLGPLLCEPHSIDFDGYGCTEHAEATLSMPKRDSHGLWVRHTVDAAEMVEMRFNWKIWLKEYGRKCMPDWSICQLHPEDWNLA